MNENTPNVFPQGNANKDLIAESGTVSNAEQSAADEMKRRTEEQIRLRNDAVVRTKASTDAGAQARAELLASMGQAPITDGERPQEMQEVINNSAMSYEDIAKLDDHLKNVEAKKQRMIADGTYREGNRVVNNNNVGIPEQPSNVNYGTPNVPPPPPVTPPPSSVGQGGYTPPNSNNVYIEQLSQPQFNAPFDVIPLPSQGKLYKGGNPNIKVAYMSTADENILTSPNLLNSGDFLEVLFNRKILDNNIRYKDLIEGDRNAIMLWLRATGYGHIYPIIVDNNGTPYETDVNLNEIKTINLNIEPDENGLFDFKLPLSGYDLKVKLLTVGEIDSIASTVEHEIEVLKYPTNNTSVYTLAKEIVSVNGDTDQSKIKSLSESMRMGDGKALREFIDSINCGVDMNIVVEIPGGGSLKTFLPINLNFFWPNL